jgi:hypothetical protein
MYLVEQAFRPRLHFAPADVSPDTRRLPTGEDVFGNRQIGEQAALLKNDRNAEPLGRMLVLDHDVALPGEIDAAKIRSAYAGQNVHKRALSGPILADKGVHFAPAHAKTNPVERLDAGKLLDDAPHAEEHIVVLNVFKLVHRVCTWL